MALEMKNVCERCAQPLTADALCFICSHECTFCPDCAGSMQYVCPNCDGELVPRPRRKISG